MKIVGVRRLDFKDANGKETKGYRFHMSGKEQGTEGVMVDNCFLYDEQAERFVSGFKSIPEMIGVEVRPYRNKKGKVEDLDRLG